MTSQGPTGRATGDLFASFRVELRAGCPVHCSRLCEQGSRSRLNCVDRVHSRTRRRGASTYKVCSLEVSHIRAADVQIKAARVAHLSRLRGLRLVDFAHTVDGSHGGRSSLGKTTVHTLVRISRQQQCHTVHGNPLVEHQPKGSESASVAPTPAFPPVPWMPPPYDPAGGGDDDTDFGTSSCVAPAGVEGSGVEVEHPAAVAVQSTSPTVSVLKRVLIASLDPWGQGCDSPPYVLDGR